MITDIEPEVVAEQGLLRLRTLYAALESEKDKQASTFAAFMSDTDALEDVSVALLMRPTEARVGLLLLRMPGLAKTVDEFTKIVTQRSQELGRAQQKADRPSDRGRSGDTEGRRSARAAIVRQTADGKQYIPTTLDTARIVLALDPEWKGRIRANEMSGASMFDGAPQDDDDVLQVAASMEDAYGVEWPIEKVRNAMRLTAMHNGYHPVRDYLANLPEWDGVHRLQRLLVDYFGADTSGGEGGDDSAAAVDRRTALFATYGRSLVIAMVARGIEPGAKVDNVLCLQGPQGWGKSSGLRALAGGAELFYDDKIPLEDPKRLGMLLRTPWLVEFAEFASLKRADVDTVKAFITQTHNEYVPMHGRTVVKEPRGFVPVGSMNPREFLLEAGRRWWVVPISSRVKVAEITRDRDQIFAEAMMEYRAGTQWWLDEDEDVVQAEDVRSYLIVSPTVDKILERTASLPRLYYTLDELWLEIMGALADRDGRVRVPTMEEQRQFGYALRDAGWVKKRNSRLHPGVRWYKPGGEP